MTITRAFAVAFAATLACVSAGRAGTDHAAAPYEGTAELKTLKQLSGRWEGVSKDMTGDGKPRPVAVEYRVTSSGSAVVETLGPDTPHEMVSVYYDNDGRLGMTHYCTLANRPRMTLKKSSSNELSLELAPEGGVDPQSAHMHAVTLSMPDKNTLVHRWVLYEGGQPKETSTFTFKRK